MKASLLMLAVALAAPRLAEASVSGRVFADVDGDGVFSDPDRPVPGAWVWFETRVRARTGEDGRFELPLAGAARRGMVWVRVPEGFAAGPVFRLLERDPGAEVDLPLRPASPADPLTFVHVSDAHIGKPKYGGGAFSGEDLRHALDQALDLEPAPAFVVMTGDLTNRERPAEIAEAAEVLLDLPVPFVPVPGNHDWVERGKQYRRTFGPPSYSFDAGGVHFVVLNDNWRKPPDLQFLARDLETVEADRPVIAFVHRPPLDAHLDRMAALGVDTLFTGHWHSNRYTDHGTLRQINTEALIRGGIDFTPAGYRIVTVQGGELTIVHRTVVEGARARITWPPDDGCAPAASLSILAAVEVSAAEPEVSVAIDGGAPLAMERRGGWTFAAAPEALAAGRHRLALEVRSRGQVVATDEREVEVCAAAAPAPAIGRWSQSQNGPGHAGTGEAEIAPPLRGLWATPVGGHLLGGSPAVGGGLVVVGLSDLDDGEGGGAVALDARTGEERWRYVTGHSVRGTPAIAGDTVVIAAGDGTVHALALRRRRHRPRPRARQRSAALGHRPRRGRRRQPLGARRRADHRGRRGLRRRHRPARRHGPRDRRDSLAGPQLRAQGQGHDQPGGAGGRRRARHRDGGLRRLGLGRARRRNRKAGVAPGSQGQRGRQRLAADRRRARLSAQRGRRAARRRPRLREGRLDHQADRGGQLAVAGDRRGAGPRRRHPGGADAVRVAGGRRRRARPGRLAPRRRARRSAHGT